MKLESRLARKVSLVAAIGALLVPCVATATLGGGANSVAADAKAFSATAGKSTQFDSYSIQEIVSEGYTLKEFVSKGGTVFAAAWMGAHHPDLSKLLGSYYEEHQKARSQLQKTKGRAKISIKSSNVVVEMGGHMRAVNGRAYVSSLIPNGVSLEDIHY
jgi:hypothetical protein